MFAGLHRFPAGDGDVGGIVFFGLSNLGIEHARAREKIGVGGAGLETGDRHARILKLIADRSGKTVDESLGAVIDRLEGTGEMTGDRAGNQHPALAARDHLFEHRLQQQQGAGNIGVDHVPPLLGVLIEEATPQTMTGVGDEDIDCTTGRASEQFLDPGRGREVCDDTLNLDSFRTQSCRCIDTRFVGGEDEVIAVRGSERRNLAADATRGTGDYGEFTRRHVRPPGASARFPWQVPV